MTILSTLNGGGSHLLPVPVGVSMIHGICKGNRFGVIFGAEQIQSLLFPCARSSRDPRVDMSLLRRHDSYFPSGMRGL